MRHSANFSTISFSLIVITFSTLLFGCNGEGISGLASGMQTSGYSRPEVVGKIQTEDLKESSGLAASECQDVLWTHNDAGSSDALIYAMDTTGKHMGVWKVTNAGNVDWESIAGYKGPDGKCYVLIADIGDNDEKRSELAIYRIPEPTVSNETSSSSRSNSLQTAPAETLKFTYSDGPNNAETILVNPQTSDIYIVTKEKKGPAGVHKLKHEFGATTVAKTVKVADIAVPSSPEGLLTGGSFSPDGKRVMLCDVKNGYELVLPDGTADPDAIWKQKPTVIDLGERKQGEGVSYGRDGYSLYASSEKKNTPLIRIRRQESKSADSN